MDLKPDFLVTLNGAYIEDAKGNVIYQSQLMKQSFLLLWIGLKNLRLIMGWSLVIKLPIQSDTFDQ